LNGGKCQNVGDVIWSKRGKERSFVVQAWDAGGRRKTPGGKTGLTDTRGNLCRRKTPFGGEMK